MSQRRSGGRENRKYGSRPRLNRYNPNLPSYRAARGASLGPLFSPRNTVAAILNAPFVVRKATKEVRRAVPLPSEGAAG